jgi:hypothetical protein
VQPALAPGLTTHNSKKLTVKVLVISFGYLEPVNTIVVRSLPICHGTIFQACSRGVSSVASWAVSLAVVRMGNRMRDDPEGAPQVLSAALNPP